MAVALEPRSCCITGLPQQPIYQRLAREHGVIGRVVSNKFGTLPAPRRLLQQKAAKRNPMAIRCGVGDKHFAKSYRAPQSLVSPQQALKQLFQQNAVFQP